MKRKNALAALGLVGVLTMGLGTNVMAATTVTDGETSSMKQTVTLEKENAAPTFSVEIPATINVKSADPETMAFSISEEDLKNIPAGKKVAIVLEDAGYEGKDHTFAMSNGKTEATYNIYSSKYNLKDPYGFNKGFVSFYGNEKATDGKFTMTRVLQVNDYDNLEAGSYAGYITYSISVVNQ